MVLEPEDLEVGVLPAEGSTKRPCIAVIAATAVNQDGRSSSLTAPHGPSQAEVLRRALEDARLSPGMVHGLQLHGTGTSLGKENVTEYDCK